MSSASTPWGSPSSSSTSVATQNYLPPVDMVVDGCLFDLDGTLMLSTECVEMFWHDFGVQHGIDSHKLLQTSHGRRTIDILKIWKPEMANKQISGELEATIPVRWASFATPVPGVRELHDALPPSQWGIVTSGTLPMATGWLKHFLKFAPPQVFITAEDVEEGKPDPAGYKLGAERLGLEKFLVFEDAPAGIKAGKAAGATVIGMATTYTPDIVKAAGADIVIRDLHSVKVNSFDPVTKKLSLTFSNIVA
ncbi:glycerol-1-phosphatase HOR2 [Sugiyamaella lignohabitans]|uniref:Glycerol-1-phosphatase HOR2 n=1 Tax=Sugiyamaella lignohabitans TaxID=796027 RepID=A0A167FLZ7_9ASCO|nr:glycerol-1-phosphatase HOR2 [Sugiyamaella lignohabitans]ANB15466.1 glycerol-1-phosphatase HOR2 [Sugiyamaella lignohabitans]